MCSLMGLKLIYLILLSFILDNYSSLESLYNILSLNMLKYLKWFS